MAIRVLFLAASPDDRTKLRLGDEVREIEQRLRATEHRDIELISKWAVRPGDLQAALLQYEPHIVHFSGHGETEGILIEDDQANVHIIPGRALARMFAVLRDNVRVVLFNACHSSEHARAVAEHVDVVIGMRAAMGDEAAVSFAAAFYMGLGHGRSVGQAFDIGVTELAVQALRDEDQPALMTRQGVDAATIMLTGPGAQAATPGTVKRAGASPSATLAACTALGPDLERIIARINVAEIAWSATLDDVTRCIESDRAVVVLAGRKAGKSTFTSQLLGHLREHRPAWTVVHVSTRPRDDERVPEYLARMREEMGIERPCDRLVVCLSGWSRRVERREGALSEHLEAFGNELRALLEHSGRRFSMVAIGGYPLYLLRYLHGDMSALNGATEQRLPALTAEQVHGLMDDVHPGHWNRADASEVHRRSGGHPYLVKALLRAWLRDPAGGWTGADDALEEDRDYLLPTLAMAADDARVARALEQCLRSGKGLPWRRIVPRDPGHYLLYAGLLRSDGRRLEFRCGAVCRLVAELFGDDEGG